MQRVSVIEFLFLIEEKPVEEIAPEDRAAISAIDVLDFVSLDSVPTRGKRVFTSYSPA